MTVLGGAIAPWWELCNLYFYHNSRPREKVCGFEQAARPPSPLVRG
jgi:hypothetical protein